MREHPSTQTVAFIAIGADDALRAVGYSYDADKYGGVMGFIDAVCNWALMLDRMADEVEASEHREFSVVFAYEVAEQFGREYAMALLENTGEKPEDIAERLIDAGTA